MSHLRLMHMHGTHNNAYPAMHTFYPEGNIKPAERYQLVYDIVKTDSICAMQLTQVCRLPSDTGLTPTLSYSLQEMGKQGRMEQG